MSIRAFRLLCDAVDDKSLMDNTLMQGFIAAYVYGQGPITPIAAIAAIAQCWEAVGAMRRERGYYGA